MKIISTLISEKQYVPILLRKFDSIIKGKVIQEAGSEKEINLVDSKIITKERKAVKDSFYNYIDAQFYNLDKDIHSVKSNKQNIVISPDDFEVLISKFNSEISKIYDSFISEKKLGPSLNKYSTIVLVGLLINRLNKDNSP